ncbi:hypothetical protein RJ45_24905 [Photobacterium gaetbulicola]|uniref:Uncharacterized protein n=1 Tax=Photobacterium gaetbulicola TaxID=1295392 RepID=A0A0B9GIF0_9GAMM|nr:hypothetical protein [Photobacterium gaetbulicola]KHT58756.1 hypothetical protein RJ45_24905 [Photobacterium gaetbulicola]
MNNVSTTSNLTVISYLLLVLGICLGFFGLALSSLETISYYLVMTSIPFYLFGKVVEAIKENTNIKIDIYNESKDDTPLVIKNNIL